MIKAFELFFGTAILGTVLYLTQTYAPPAFPFVIGFMIYGTLRHVP